MELASGRPLPGKEAAPHGWEFRAVNEMGSVLAGKALAANGPGPHRRYLRTKNVLDGRIDLDDVLMMPMTDSEFERFRLAVGDVLLNEGQSLELVGRCAMYQGESAEPCAMQNQLLRFRAGPRTDAAYAAHLFRHCQSNGTFAGIATQTTSVAHLGSSRFAKLRLPWPIRIEEQRAIAAALGDVDALLASLDKLIAKKRDLKQAAMQQLLTGRTRLPGFSGKWAERRFLELVRIANGQVDPRQEPYRSMVLIAPDHIEEATGKIVGRRSAAEQGAISGKYLFNRGDVLYSKIRPYLRKVAVADFEGLCSADMYPLAATEWADARFVAALMLGDEFSTFAANASARSGIPKINREELAQCRLRVPAVPEQRAIAAVLSDMDAELDALERRREKTVLIKQGMMQELLTGRTRLV